MYLLKQHRFAVPYLAILLFALAFIVIGANHASADSYNPSLLVSDTIFTNSGAMSASQVQNFLNQMNSGLKNYSAVEACDPSTPTLPDPYSASYYPSCGQTESAATIIYDAGQAYGISQEVLLATMQKEQSLITDPNPTQSEINCATGYKSCGGGDDTFFAQVDNAAWQFRTDIELMNGIDWWGYTPSSYACKNAGYGTFDNSNGQPTSMMLYSAGLYPNANVTFGDPTVYSYNTSYSAWEVSDGLSPAVEENITLLSSATAALYCYTPYVGPYSTTGYSGSYNFVESFDTWFGSTIQPASPVYIPNGTYNIAGLGSGKDVDVSGGNAADGTPVQLYDKNGTPAQQWQFTRDTNGYYTIENVLSGKYLDVTGASAVSGTKTQIWDGNGTCAQEWAIETAGSNYTFLNACSGLALDASGGGTSDGTQLQVYKANGTASQIWSLNSLNTPPLESGFYSIFTSGGTALDVTGGGTANGTPIQTYSNNQTGSQQWQFILLSDGMYGIRNPQSGRYLDVTGGSTTPGTDLQIWDDNDTCSQQWAVTHNTDSSYSITSSCSGLNLDVWMGGLTVNGNPVDVYTSNGTSSQKWTLTKLTGIPNGFYSFLTPSGTAMDVTGGATKAGTPIQIYSRNGTGSQQWAVTAQTNGTYELYNAQSNKYLDVSGGSSTPGTRLQIWNGNNSCAQEWNISQNSNSTFSITSSCSGLNLDVWMGGLTVNGNPVDVYTSNNTPAQEWTIYSPF